MNVPQLRFNGFDGEWEKILFKDIFFEKTEKTNDMSQYPLFSLTVEKGVTPKTDRYERSFLVKEGNDNYKIVNPNDFVYNPMNLTLGAVAKHKKNINISVSGYYNVFSTNPKFNSDFLEMYLKSYKMILHYKAIATGSLIEKQRVHFSQFVKIKKPIPSLKEQNKIGEFFAKLDQRIEKQQEKIEKLEQFKKGMMQKIFSQELRFKDEDGNTYPDFVFGKLGDYLIHLGSGVTPRGGRDVYTDSGVYFIRSQNVYNKGLVLDDIAYISEVVHKKMKNSKVLSNDVLLNITGASIGRTALVPKDFSEANVNQHVCIIRTKSSLYPSFLKFYLESPIGQKLIFQDQAGQTREALNLAQIRSFNIFIPSLKEQIKISNYISKIEKKVDKEEEKLMILEAQKKGLIQKMFI